MVELVEVVEVVGVVEECCVGTMWNLRLTVCARWPVARMEGQHLLLPLLALLPVAAEHPHQPTKP